MELAAAALADARDFERAVASLSDARKIERAAVVTDAGGVEMYDLGVPDARGVEPEIRT